MDLAAAVDLDIAGTCGVALYRALDCRIINERESRAFGAAFILLTTLNIR